MCNLEFFLKLTSFQKIVTKISRHKIHSKTYFSNDLRRYLRIKKLEFEIYANARCYTECIIPPKGKLYYGAKTAIV